MNCSQLTLSKGHRSCFKPPHTPDAAEILMPCRDMNQAFFVYLFRSNIRDILSMRITPSHARPRPVFIPRLSLPPLPQSQSPPSSTHRGDRPARQSHAPIWTHLRLDVTGLLLAVSASPILSHASVGLCTHKRSTDPIASNCSRRKPSAFPFRVWAIRYWKLPRIACNCSINGGRSC